MAFSAGEEMGYGEADTQTKPIDPAIHRRGWTEDMIRREKTETIATDLLARYVEGREWSRRYPPR